MNNSNLATSLRDRFKNWLVSMFLKILIRSWLKIRPFSYITDGNCRELGKLVGEIGGELERFFDECLCSLASEIEKKLPIGYEVIIWKCSITGAPFAFKDALGLVSAHITILGPTKETTFLDVDHCVGLRKEIKQLIQNDIDSFVKKYDHLVRVVINLENLLWTRKYKNSNMEITQVGAPDVDNFDYALSEFVDEYGETFREYTKGAFWFYYFYDRYKRGLIVW